MKFNFKEFVVQQERSAAKITTDATIFAACLPLHSNFQRVLEIGAGTGVMSIMLRQRQQFILDAVEIDLLAYEEAKKNFKNSPFSTDLCIHHSAIQQFQPEAHYDLIFTNPPFFTNNLQSNRNSRKNTAYHTSTLSFVELSASIDRLLLPSGVAYVMLPEYESILFEGHMKDKGLYRQLVIRIKHNQRKEPLRRIVGYARKENSHPEEELIVIRMLDGQFSKQYIKLMKPFLTIF